MPPAKRAATSTEKSKSSPKTKAAKAAKPAAAKPAAAKAATAKSAAGKSSAGGRSAAAKTTKTTKTTKAASAKVTAAKPTPARSRSTASASRPATSAARSRSTEGTRAAAARVKRAASTEGTGVISIAEQLVKGSVKPKDVVLLTREHIQEALDDAASRGRVTRKDANELVAELVRRGRSGGDDVVSEIEGLLDKGRGQIESATKRAARSEPVDRIVRGADRARRAAGVGSSFPISGYADLNVSQVQARLKELSKPELRKVLTYERKHANRKSVVGVIEKSL